ncbi:DUF2750 domain-containing protein [Methylosinus sp. H3A]|uniref:DUF2750 domain-containing protein n=1 Tax=Methylosinus sp. H3A TaxID=2785786 RepID=UPI0018C2A72B|nr:DUF2750 domain-containing protein [Methylosinus sp. H3A]MBG0809989.1 DUF2750 domain-containing protein [Methylosinus sp. H3A]
MALNTKSALTNSISGEYGLQDALRCGRLKFAGPEEPNEKEFQALIGVANAERRMERFNRGARRGGEVWALEKDGNLLTFDIEDVRGTIRKAVPFWPAQRYVEHVKSSLQCDAEVFRIGVIEWIDNTLTELRKRKLLVGKFWLPGKRTVVEAPLLVARGAAEGIAWNAKLEQPRIAPQMADEEYNRVLRKALRSNMGQGPKGDLP